VGEGRSFFAVHNNMCALIFQSDEVNLKMITVKDISRKDA